MKVRVRDIAVKAKVSPATVSNALNKKQGVSSKVAERIMRIASEMGYEPPKDKSEPDHKYIRLVVYKSHGLVVMDTQFFAELIESIQRECKSEGLELMITHLNAKDADLAARAQEIRNEDCMGILLLGTEMSPEELARFTPCKSTLVALDNLFRHEHVNAVVMNNYDAGYQATNALYQAGHRDIGHITSTVSFSNVRYRRKGFQAALEEKGIHVTPDSIWYVTPTLEGAYQDMLKLLDSGRKLPTAFFAGNDIMAVGSMRAMHERGVRIPDDVSIIGMDDMALCLVSNPPLSTVRVLRQEMGIAAVQSLLFVAAQMKTGVLKTELSVDLVERSSVRTITEAESAATQKRRKNNA
ncbi:MAG: LacI family DNA-binding transcriptional regulator [Bacillota bacterium]